MNITLNELCFGCPKEFEKYMDYCKKLTFEEEPNYNYLKQLIIDIAMRLNISLHDGMFDWCVKAVLIKNYPYFYETISQQYTNIFNDKGKFKPIENMDTKMEQQIYAEARNFEFNDPKELGKLLRLEEMQKLKNRNYPNNQERLNECQKKLNVLNK